MLLVWLTLDPLTFFYILFGKCVLSDVPQISSPVSQWNVLIIETLRLLVQALLVTTKENVPWIFISLTVSLDMILLHQLCCWAVQILELVFVSVLLIPTPLQIKISYLLKHWWDFGVYFGKSISGHYEFLISTPSIIEGITIHSPKYSNNLLIWLNCWTADYDLHFSAPSLVHTRECCNSLWCGAHPNAL